MDELYKKLLNDANCGGKGEGRFLLNTIVGMLLQGYNKDLNHGELPKEYVRYLIDKLLLILDSPKDADKILKITKPPRREKEFDLQRDGAITYLCMLAMKNEPNKSKDGIFGDVEVELSEDYRDLLQKKPLDDKNEISKKTIERIYNRTHPIIEQFKNIEGFKWILKIIKNEPIGDMPSDPSTVEAQKYIADAKEFLRLREEITEYEATVHMLEELPRTGDDFNNSLIKELEDTLNEWKSKST